MRVFSNLAVSLDGKIADRAFPRKALGTAADRKMMNTLRVQSDVIVVGAGTLRTSPHTYRVRGPKSTRQPANAVISASGDLDPAWEFWSDPDVIRFVFCSELGLARAKAAAQERAFVIPAGKSHVDLSMVLKRFKQSGLNNVLVEGGGELVANFLEAKLLQELFVTVTPWLLGGRTNPTLVGGTGLTAWSALSLAKAKKVKDEIYCHYKVKGFRSV